MNKEDKCVWCGYELDDGAGYVETDPNEYMCMECLGTCDAQLALIKKLQLTVETLRAEIERLKCCGNCVNRISDGLYESIGCAMKEFSGDDTCEWKPRP